MREYLRELIHHNHIAQQLITSCDFRTVAFSAFSLVGNLAYHPHFKPHSHRAFLVRNPLRLHR